MAFASMFLLVLFAIAVGLFLVFTFGLILFIVGLANKKKIKRDNKKWPVVLIVIGLINMIPPVIITIILVIAASVYNYRIDHMLDLYDTIPEAWKNVETNDRKAGTQALDMLLERADANDREGFIECFAEEVRREPGFEDAVDAFFEAYPGNLSSGEFTYNAHGTSQTGEVKKAIHGYQGPANGEYYFITVGYCYWNNEHPEEVGVTYFAIMDVAGDASYHAGLTEINRDNDELFLFCYFPSPDEVNARLIDRYTYLWTDTEGPVLTSDEMREYLADFETLQEAIDAGGIGQPNANPVYNGGIVSCEYFYELQPVNGEPRYAHIRTAGQYGRIIEAYLSTPDSTDYDHMIVEHRNKGT